MKKLIIVFLLLITIKLYAQTASGNIETYIGTIIDNVPGDSGNNYIEPTTNQLNSWNTVISYLLENNLIDARADANGFNYQVTEFTDTSISPNQVFYILEEKTPQSNYWGTYVFSQTPKRGNLIIQAPHIKNDVNTGKEAMYCFKNNLARAVFINGTHRCNNNASSLCSGTTTTCSGSSEAYKISDLAHNTNSVFQKTTENIFTYLPESVFIQLHGFGWSSGDPYVIMSNGSRETPEIDYTALIKNALLVEDNSLTFEIAHVNTSWTTLIAFTNTQGRLINYSTNYCSENSEGTTGRFIHIEQEKSKLRDDIAGWAKMSNALASVFIEDSDGDGVASNIDLDDSDACNPDSYYTNCGTCDVLITSDNFDSDDLADFGNWNDGGNNVFNSEINALGDKSVRLKHGIEAANTDPDVDPQSSIYTNALDLSTYTQLKIELSYFSPTTDGYENGDDFLLEISTDGGNNYIIYKSWVAGTDFVLDYRYFDSVLISGITFTANTIIRIRSHADNDLDRVYIDNIVIKGCNDSVLSITDFNVNVHKIEVYPNPTKGEVLVNGKNMTGIEVYNLIGQKILGNNYKIETSSINIDLKKEKSGVYFLKIKTNKGLISKKVIRL